MNFNHPLCQNNKEFFGYTVFTLTMNDIPIRFVTEKDARHVIEKVRNSPQGEAADSGKERQPCGENNTESVSFPCTKCGAKITVLATELPKRSNKTTHVS